MLRKNKIVVILGPTASGKSDIAVKLAKKLDGEIISADSRQVYRYMNVGTGKVPLDSSSPQMGRVIKGEGLNKKIYYSSGIPHHMIDIVSPKTDYNVAKFKKAVDKIIPQILKRGKVPIICGGTGFWIKAIVDNVKFPAVKPNWKLRQKLNKQSTLQLFKVLKCLDSRRARTIDRNNKIRLIRAIEICKTLGQVPSLFPQPPLPPGEGGLEGRERDYKFLQIGLKIPKQKLHQNIKKRLEARFKQGMIKEVKDLHYNPPAGGGVSWKKLESFGLEYKWIALYLQNKISKDDMQAKLFQEIKNYAKRQMTWFRKDKRTIWAKDSNTIGKKIKEFME